MSRPAGSTRTALAILAALALTTAGCAGGQPPGGDAAPAAGSTTPDPAGSASAGPVVLTTAPAAAGWLAGNRVTVEAASYDPATGEVVLDTLVENTANTESFGADVVQWVLLDTGRGAPTPVSAVSSVAVPSSSTSIELSFRLPAETPVDLTSAALVLGGPGYETSRIPLGDDSAAVGAEPSEQPATGTADAGGLSFTATSVQVLPWACADVDDYGPAASGRVWYEPGGEGEAALVIWGDIHEAVSIVGGDTPLAASLASPDGTVAPQIGTVNTVFDVNEGIEDYPLCFTVPAPAAGEYVLTWNTYRGASATLGISIIG